MHLRQAGHGMRRLEGGQRLRPIPQDVRLVEHPGPLVQVMQHVGEFPAENILEIGILFPVLSGSGLLRKSFLAKLIDHLPEAIGFPALDQR